MRVLVRGSRGRVARSLLGCATRMPLDEGILRAVADAEIGWKANAAGGDPAL